MVRLGVLAGSAWALSLMSVVAPASAPHYGPPGRAERSAATHLFTTSDDCMACHNGMSAPSGEDVSIGTSWRATMMANSSRDPYWQASVRRETIDHPQAAAEVEDECSTCHMPMSHTAAHASGGKARVFAHLPVTETDDVLSRLAHDGVSCTLCHQIATEKLGTRDSFTGGFVIDTTVLEGERPVFGPFAPTKGLLRVMHSATGYRPAEGRHLQQSELCATCHTLYTTARGARGEAVGTLPEQVPFLEWQHSRYRSERSCQSCHMPVVEEPTPIASVLGEPREGASRHTFLGGNSFVLRMLNRYRADLGVTAQPHELEAAARGTLEHLRDASARLTIRRAARERDSLDVAVEVENLSGHKLPTAYPARRAWIRLAVRDGSGRILFESGALAPSGAIVGNDNDDDASKFEPHYRQITRADQVQIYESILVDPLGEVTTGLLRAVRYGKDNRLLPHGFDKATAGADIAVRGDAAGDEDFIGGVDRVQYVIGLPAVPAAVIVEAELLFQPIGFRWAENLRSYSAPEPRRFVSYYESMSGASAATLARATQTVPVSERAR